MAAGEEQAFRELFERYQRKLFTYLLRVTNSREISEDIVQNIFLKIWAQRESLTAIQNLNAYLHRMAHNEAYNGFKRMALETAIVAELRKEERGADTLTPVAELVSKEVKQHIRAVIDQLAPQQRKIFLLSREHGLKQREIAEQLGLSITTVKKYMVTALKFVREELSKDFGAQAVAIFVIYHLY